MEKDRKDLADEYVVLKTNYLALVRESEKEVDYMYYVFVNTLLKANCNLNRFFF
jgi:hypothetical protein